MPSQPLVTYFLAPSQCSLGFSVPLHNVMYTLLALRVIIGDTLLSASLSGIKTYQHPPGHYRIVSVSQEGALEALGRLWEEVVLSKWMPTMLLLEEAFPPPMPGLALQHPGWA